MQDNFFTFDYATIRFVPRVEREEFFNVGVIVSCPGQKFLKAKIFLSEEKLRVFAPDAEADTIRQYLAIIPKICAGDADAGVIGKMAQRERFYWLTAQRSTIIQTSSVHTGICDDAGKLLGHLFEKMVR